MHWLSHSGNWCGSGFFFHGPVGMMLTFLFWVVVLFLGVRLAQSLWQRQVAPQPSGLEVLQRRYAKGEIDEQTYLKIKKKMS